MGIVPNEAIDVFVICPEKGGFSDHKRVTPNTTAKELFDEMTDNADLSGYKVRVNRESVPMDYVLKEGDRITISFRKMEGA